MISPEQKIILIILSYLVGAISSSIIICQIKKVDIRQIGSGNAGATNTVRALGKKFGAIVLLLDMLKGSLPTMIAKILSPESLIFPIYFSFKGGKGAATFIGTIIVIFPIGALICFLVWISVLILSGYVGLATISAAIIFPISIFFFAESNLMFFGITSTLFVLIAHYKNIIRLINRKESRFDNIYIFNPKAFWYKK